MANSSLSQDEKTAVKIKLFGKGGMKEAYSVGTEDWASDGVVDAMYKVFVENESDEMELSYLKQLDEEEQTKYKVRVKDKNGKSYVRYADRAKITQLRQNPNIESVEMTDHGDPKGNRTRAKKDFDGDLTVVLFPFYKDLKKDQISLLGKDLGDSLVSNSENINSFNIVGGFLNLTISDKYYLNFIESIKDDIDFGKSKKQNETYIVEFSSPNTNKPLHLGHIRNNLLGYSISRILEANGKNVKKVQIINDRGIHICKSMIAWKQYGEGKTPKSENIKGDKFVGDYYILFDKIHNEQKNELL